MAHNKVQLQLVFLGGVLAYSSQSQPALAHTNHSHSPEPETANIEETTQPSDETSNDAAELEKQQNPAEGVTAIESVPASPGSPLHTVSTAKLADGFSLGFGESIFGLMIAAPFLLLSLKRGHR
ncbi:MAG: hypothetical protein AAF821_01520 [Cyanobacteria bacterium P01_D01_bin.156]